MTIEGALNDLNNLLKADDIPIYYKPSIKAVIETIMMEKTPMPKMGRWILQPSNKEQGERDFIWWKCSECGQVIYSETEQDRRKYHAYCGMCGCKMQEVE